MSDKPMNPHLTKLLEQCGLPHHNWKKRLDDICDLQETFDKGRAISARRYITTGIQKENARLMPIITALVNEVESLRAAQAEFLRKYFELTIDAEKKQFRSIVLDKSDFIALGDAFNDSDKRLAKLAKGEL